MRGLILTIGILGAFASAVGCKKAPVDDTSALENPPPKLPNCPDLPELKNITLKDGTIVDVRIVKFGDTKMYFPKDIVESAFVDKQRFEGIVHTSYLKKFDPDIYAEECPGVVHELVIDGVSTWPVIAVNPKPLRIELPVAKNLQYGKGVGTIFFTSHIDPMPPRAQAMRGFFNDSFVWQSKLVVMIRGRDQDVGRWQSSKSLNAFVSWLNTPPVSRNNDAIFTPKVDSK